MAKKKQLMDYVDEYLENGKINGECTFTGDYKKGNKAYKKLDKIFNIAINSDDKEKFYLDIFKNARDANTLTFCCVDMLKLNIEPKLARLKLEEIINDEDIEPIFRSDARLTLEEWDNGNIKRVI